MLLELFCRFPRHRKVYTDGSKEDKRTAMSFVCDDHEFSCRINDEASICTAELLAIEAAIEYIWVQPIIKRSFTPMKCRRDDVVLCRARIGHAYFTNGYLLRGELRPMCCNTCLTVRHVLLSCAKYAHIRRKYFAFNSLFELFRDTPAGFIIQFLRECNLYYMF